MSWFQDYVRAADETDALKDKANHRELLAAGLLGEAGSVAAEIKKTEREGPAYPAYRRRLTEEVGDLLWYLVRLGTVLDAELVDPDVDTSSIPVVDRVRASLSLGASVGPLVEAGVSGESAREALRASWRLLRDLAAACDVQLEAAAIANIEKIQSRWPTERVAHVLFDEDEILEDQFSRELTIEFRELDGTVALRYGNIGIGDRITDNIESPDSYRYHDVFHMAYVAFVGWSPVMRALLRCKRKQNSAKDRDQDGARAAIIEEAISATVFARAKEMNYFEDADSVDYDLLKLIQEFTRGYEVESVPLWQWEDAILEGFRVFRLLRGSGSGSVSWDMTNRELVYEPST